MVACAMSYMSNPLDVKKPSHGGLLEKKTAARGRAGKWGREEIVALPARWKVVPQAGIEPKGMTLAPSAYRADALLVLLGGNS